MGKTNKDGIRALSRSDITSRDRKEGVDTYDMLATVYFMSFNSPRKVGATAFLSQMKKRRLSESDKYTFPRSNHSKSSVENSTSSTPKRPPHGSPFLLPVTGPETWFSYNPHTGSCLPVALT